MRKVFIFSILVLLLLTTVSAFSPTSPAIVSLSCGDYTSLEISGVFANITDIADTMFVHPSKVGVDVAFDYKNLNDGGNTLKVLIMTNANYCTPGSAYTEFNLGSENYRINIELLKEEYSLGEKLISVNEALKIGQDISFGILGISDGSVHYILQGCEGVSEEDTMTDEVSKTCLGNLDLRVKILTTIPELGVVKLEVFSSEPSFVLTKSNTTTPEESTECVLGLDTLGAKVKRGNIFAIKTINANTGKFVSSVAVTILDQQGELSPIAGVSSNIGFFSERFHEDYLQDIIVQLEKEGCEPSTQVILFEQSYDDYKLAKESEQGAFQLVLNMSGKFAMSTAISRSVKNSLGEVVEGVEVKITKPDTSSLTVTTNAAGSFSFTPDVIGIWKVQGGLDGYEATRLNEIEIFQDKTYLVVIKVNGEQKSEYSKGDRISFELRDINNTLVPLTIDSTFAGIPLTFINGVSDTVTFDTTSTLSIPAVEGYIAQSLTLSEKTTNMTNVWWGIGIGIGILVLIIIIVAIIKKVKGGATLQNPLKKSSIPDALKDVDINLGG